MLVVLQRHLYTKIIVLCLCSWPKGSIRIEGIATGQLESHGRLRAVRKDIARIYTVLQERELGIVVDPDQAEEAQPESAAATPVVERVKA
jgi:hypothetical protein